MRLGDAAVGVDDYFGAAAADVYVQRVFLAAAARRCYEGLRRGVDYFGFLLARYYFDVDSAFFLLSREHFRAVFRVAHGARRAGAVCAHAEGLHQMVEGLHGLAEPSAAFRAYRAACEGVFSKAYRHTQKCDFAAFFIGVFFNVAYQKPHGVASDVDRRDGVHVFHCFSLSSSAAFL